jgi:uncharacterized protein (DUF2147 family)
MRHRVAAPALGVLAAGLFATVSPSLASAADPSGIWVRDDGSAKVEIKKCGRGLCSKVVWLRNPEDSQGRPLHDARNEDASKRGRPIIGLPLFTNMPPAGPNTWVGNVYNPEEGHIYTNVKVTLVSRQQIVLRGCKTWLLCGEKMWTRSHLPAVPAVPATPEKLIEVKATAEPGRTDKAEPRPAPKPEAPMVEAFREREPLSAPGFTLAMTDARWEPLPPSGANVPSMIVMTSPTPTATTTPRPHPTEVAQKQDLLVPVRFQPKTQAAVQAEAVPAAPGFVEPKPSPVVTEAQEEWPWQKRRSARLVSTRTGEQWPWLKRRSARFASARAGD